jgi:hypothetical protein
MGAVRQVAMRLAAPGVRVVVAAAVGLALALPPLPAAAELPPWVYGEQQRQAPLVVDLRIEELRAVPAGFRARGRVLAVRRQDRGRPVRTQQLLTLRLPPLPERAPAWVGPSPLAPPRLGDRLTAWLQPAAGRSTDWLPAAGGRSFGPSLEASPDPNAPASGAQGPIAVPGAPGPVP